MPSQTRKSKSKLFNKSMKEFKRTQEYMCPSSLPDKQLPSKNTNIGQPNLLAKGASKSHHVPKSKGVRKPTAIEILLQEHKAFSSLNSKETQTRALKRKREVDYASQPTHFKAMSGLVPKATERLLGQYSDSSSRLKKQATSDKEKDNTSAISKGISMSQDNCTTEGNERQDEIAIAKEIVKEVGEYHKEGETMKAKHTLDSTLSDIHCNSGAISSYSLGKDPPKFQWDETVAFENVEKRGSRERIMGQLADCMSKKRKAPLFEENPKELEDDMSCKQMKKPKQSNVTWKDEAKGGNGNHNHVSVEDDTISISENDHAKVSMSSCVEQQFYSCSKPIDKPTWSGIFKTNDKKYVSLDGHLSTKSCEKAWSLSRQLLKVVEVKKLSRLEVWPKAWEVSTPTGDNIGTYFFPHEMRQDKGLDQLVREVIENDLALQAIIGEAEMLIFPSILLPNHHQTFQGKPYLWGVFKRRQDKGVEKEKQQNLVLDQPNHKLPGEESNQEMIQTAGALPLEGHMLPHNKSTQEVEEASRLKGPTSKGLDLKGPGEEGVPAQATPAATNAATNVGAFPVSHGQVNPSMGQTANGLMGFVVRKSPKLDRIIRELEGEGALVFAMQGEMVGAGSWAGSKATATQK